MSLVFVDTFNCIDVFSQEATAVDTAKKSVTLNNGTTLQYTSLVIATGGDVSILVYL